MPVIRTRLTPTPAIRTSTVSPSATKTTLPCQKWQRGEPGSLVQRPVLSAWAGAARAAVAMASATRARGNMRRITGISFGGKARGLDRIRTRLRAKSHAAPPVSGAYGGGGCPAMATGVPELGLQLV